MNKFIHNYLHSDLVLLKEKKNEIGTNQLDIRNSCTGNGHFIGQKQFQTHSMKLVLVRNRENSRMSNGRWCFWNFEYCRNDV